MQLLVIEDDARLAAHIGKGLRAAGHDVRQAADGRDGLARAMAENFDVIVLDRRLPYLDGLDLLRGLRAREVATPVLILSALGEMDERVRGLEAGGDDYLAKPFEMPELLARINALGRRGRAGAARLRVGDLELDLLARRARRGGAAVQLTEREFRLLETLARNAGRVVTRTMLLEQVWRYRFNPQTNIVDQHVSRIRQKLGEPALIRTVRGSGYVIEAPQR